MILKDIHEMFANDLRDPSYAAGYLNITLEEDGIEGLLYALQKVARAHGISKVALNSGLPRESLYRALSDKGNPSVKTLARVLDSLGLRLTLAPTVYEPCTMDENPVAVDVRALRLRMEEEIAIISERARAEQEEARRATLELQAEGRRTIAQMQQLTAAIMTSLPAHDTTA